MKLPGRHPHPSLPANARVHLEPPAAVDEILREPGLITVKFTDRAELLIWPKHRLGRDPLAHQANIILPSGEKIYLRSDSLNDDWRAFKYLRLANAYVIGCIHDYVAMTVRLPAKDSSIVDAHYVHHMFETPFLRNILFSTSP